MSVDTIARSTILIVDDMESNRYVAATHLRRAGFSVVEAGTGEEALHLAATGGLDLVVLDVNLPDMTGFEVCERMKEMTSGVLPVLHLSATAIDSSDRSEGLRRGADAYLVEPVDRGELLATIGALLRRSTSERMNLEFSNRLRRLNELTLAVHSAPTIRRLLHAVAEGAAEISQADVLLVSFPDRLVMSAAPSGVYRTTTLAPDAANDLASVADGPDGTIEAALAQLGLGHPAPVQQALAIRTATEVDSVLVMSAGPDARPSRETDLLVRQLIQAATTALKNLRNYQTKHTIALTLQRTLLPGTVPRVPGLDVAVRYEASAEYTEVGGDFYELFALDGRRSAIAIGDVVGHSLEAATTMAQLRTAVRAYALEGHGPVANLTRLNSLLLRFHPEMIATVCLLEFDADTGETEVANAGHLPPLIVDGAGPRYLDAHGTMLGVDELRVVPSTFVFEPGQTMVLATDGLIERRGEHLDLGFDRLAAACADSYGSVDELCERILRDVGPLGGAQDDIALMALLRT